MSRSNRPSVIRLDRGDRSTRMSMSLTGVPFPRATLLRSSSRSVLHRISSEKLQLPTSLPEAASEWGVGQAGTSVF